MVAPSGQFLLYLGNANEIYRISLPDGKTTRLPFDRPKDFSSGVITWDGKALVYVEYVNNSKLMLWENPFVRE